MKISYYSICFLFLLISCGSSETIDLMVGHTVFQAEVAVTAQERQQGFMNRKELADTQGMLFVFEEDEILSFWMRNTLIPLSIAYIDKEGVIIDIKEMNPMDESPVRSSAPVRYAFEVNRGGFEKAGIHIGDRVHIPEEYR